MDYQIVPIAEQHIPSFREAVHAIAQEKQFLALLEAPQLEDTRKFVLKNLEQGNPQFVVLSGDKVVGWCDVVRNTSRVVYSHCGTLGVGLLPEFRGQRIGRRLMQMTIDAAWQRAIRELS